MTTEVRTRHGQGHGHGGEGTDKALRQYPMSVPTTDRRRTDRRTNRLQTKAPLMGGPFVLSKPAELKVAHGRRYSATGENGASQRSLLPPSGLDAQPLAPPHELAAARRGSRGPRGRMGVTGRCPRRVASPLQELTRASTDGGPARGRRLSAPRRKPPTPPSRSVQVRAGLSSLLAPIGGALLDSAQNSRIGAVPWGFP